MANESFDVVIVGGGMGGLNLAALLANDGKRVLVLEKSGRDRLGGRAASGKIGNAAIDNGIKGLILAGSQDEIYRRIGKKMPENVCRWTNSGQVYMNGEWRKLDEMIKAMGLARGDVYIANVVKVRPPNNRTPTPREADLEGPFLEQPIAILQGFHLATEDVFCLLLLLLQIVEQPVRHVTVEADAR